MYLRLLPISLLAFTGGLAFLPANAQVQKTAKIATKANDVRPLPSSAALKLAQTQAKREKKRVLVIYHASWCGWCKRLDQVMEKPEFREPIEANYVVVHLDVQEHGDQKSLENPGANELMKKMGGEKSGLPFYVFLDDKGKKLADSNAMPKEQNIGYPGDPDEIAAFVGLLKKTAPRLKAAEAAQLVSALKANAPKE